MIWVTNPRPVSSSGTLVLVVKLNDYGKQDIGVEFFYIIILYITGSALLYA